MPRLALFMSCLLCALSSLADDSVANSAANSVTNSVANSAPDFGRCAAGLGDRARLAGVDGELVDQVLAGLSPIERVIALDRKQPEFVQTFEEYVGARVTDARVERGRSLLADRQAFLADVLKRYGVPPRYLLAFWGLETNFGAYMGSVQTLDALATLACDPRRGEFFASEFVDALRLVELEALPLERLRGSWAGAVGHTQFMPSSYLRYAVDGDGDGQRDLWQSERDALASGANYLQELGWVPGLRWGRRVSLPSGFPYELAGLDQTRSVKDWGSLGATLTDGSALPALALEASLLLPAGYRGPAFLVYENFRMLMRWNQSQSYALSVGLLADRLVGAGPLAFPPAASVPMRTDDVASAQRLLNALKYNVGKADGVLGRRTRAALREFQLGQGLPADGFLDAVTFESLEHSGTVP